MSERAVTAADSLTAGATTPSFTWGAVTHVGGVRDHNEDAFYASDEVCVVADGMGGHDAGEVASHLVTHLVSEMFASRRPDVTELPRLVSALNAAVVRQGAENNTQGMGTTLVGVAVADNTDSTSAVVFHVGDSRCYRLADGMLSQLTVDHSHVQDLVRAGRITPTDALTHPLRNVITRALGADAVVEADLHVLAEQDCRLLLCSDGLSGEIDDDRIWKLLATHDDPSKAAVALVEAVLEGPARDNVTAMVVDVRFPLADPTNEVRRTGLELVTSDAESTAERGLDITPAPVREAGDATIVDPTWAPPVADDRRPVTPGRTPTPPDAAAWGAPDPSSTDRNTK